MIYLYRYRKQNRQQGELDIFTYVQWKDEDVEPEGYEETVFVEQTKPLSDEEIEQVIKTFQLNSLMKNLDYKDFARAIEAKVRGEK